MKDHREVVGVARGPVGRQIAGRELVDELRQHGEQEGHLVGDLHALRDLALAAEGDEALGAGLRQERRELRRVEHRRQRREHDAAVQAPEHRDRGLDRMAAEEDDHVPRLHTAVGEPARHADRGAAQSGEGDLAVLEDQGHLVRVLLDSAVEVLPEVAVAPVPVGVVALGLRLERQRGLGHRVSLLRQLCVK